MRLPIAVVLGVGLGVASAVVLGDYPLTGSVPWVAAVLIPGAIGITMTTVGRQHRRLLWAATGPLAAASLGWGVRIATGWGLDPVPTAAWASIAIGGAWPIVWALVPRNDRDRKQPVTDEAPDPSEPEPVAAPRTGSADG